MSRFNHRLPILAVSIVALCLAAAASRADVISPVSVSQQQGLVDSVNYNPIRLINGSGLIAGPHPQSHLLGTPHAWATNGSSPDYFVNGPQPILLFDLGEDHFINGVFLWNMNNGSANSTRNGVRLFDLGFATEAEGPAGIGSTIAGVSNLLAAQAADSDPNPIARQDISLGGTVIARYVRMTITDNYFGLGHGTTGGDRVGMAEIAFSATPVPEPASASLSFVGGIAVLLFSRFRRSMQR